MTTFPAHPASPARLEPPQTTHVGGAGEAVEIDAGGDLDPSPPPPLSVAQLQHALRLARRYPSRPATSLGERVHCDITLIAAHPAAGASTLALAVADALAATGRPVVLLDCADADRSVLRAATDTELGALPTGDWQLGRRGTVSLYRPAGADAAPDCESGVLPAPPPVEDATTVIADLSGRDPRQCPPPDSRGIVVLVCRATVPGFAHAEAQLTTMAASGPTHIVAVLGPRRWPRLAAASIGPRLAQLRDEGRVISVPLQPRLAITGVTADPLPAALLTAAHRLLQLIPEATRATSEPDDTERRAGDVDHGFALLPVSALEPVR